MDLFGFKRRRREKLKRELRNLRWGYDYFLKLANEHKQDYDLYDYYMTRVNHIQAAIKECERKSARLE
jgi:hypothetical protein